MTDLDLKTQIVPCPTVREIDGLAMSSRNQRLDAKARGMAPVIRETLAKAAQVIESGQDVRDALDAARHELAESGFDEVDYLELRGDPDLAPLTKATRPGRIFVAAWLNGVRLIDNLAVRAATAADRAATRPVETA